MTRGDERTRRLDSLFERLDNRGRWGEDDQLGTLNYITAPKRVAAAALVTEGRSVSLGHPLTSTDGPNGMQVEREPRYFNAPEHPLAVPPSAADRLAFDVHQQGMTHVDALSHIGSRAGLVYNGRQFDDIATQDGLTFGSVQALRNGIFTRGVLLDVAAARGSRWLEPDHGIGPDDLEAAEQHGAIRVETGDAVVVRTGALARAGELGPHPLLAGPTAEAAEWLHHREAALYTGDAPEHISASAARILGRAQELDAPPDPSDRYPLAFHQLAIPAMGLTLLDHADVETLAVVCRELGRFDFLFVVAPLPIPGGTGSPVNPLAVF